MALLTFSLTGIACVLSLYRKKNLVANILPVDSPGVWKCPVCGHTLLWGRLANITDCTPYLLQLGLTKSRTSLVWVAGPLSGLIMQPLIGVIADRSRSKWGRRRPFMIAGAVIVAFCLLLLGWASELVASFVQDVEKVDFLSQRVCVLG